MDIKRLRKGMWVEYSPEHGKPQAGRVKYWNEKFVFVVYHCGDDWDNYTDYTAAATYVGDLREVEM
ncbi:MAG: hypothetical protein KAR40_06195 [Candidatus Sabulitectum sp.]|nr:hypothetical protein [Candidatus Sabulitectum sp.]